MATVAHSTAVPGVLLGPADRSGMELRYPETKREVTVAAFVVAMTFGVSLGLLVGDGLVDAFTYGIAVAIGFATGVLLFFDEPEE